MGGSVFFSLQASHRDDLGDTVFGAVAASYAAFIFYYKVEHVILLDLEIRVLCFGLIVSDPLLHPSIIVLSYIMRYNL